MSIEEDIIKEELDIKEETELGAVMNNLDDDRVDTKTGLSKIDFNTRLSQDLINACLVFDELKRMGLLPEGVELSRQTKRLHISKDGMGRLEKVKIVSAEREQKQGFGDKFANLFRRHE